MVRQRFQGREKAHSSHPERRNEVRQRLTKRQRAKAHALQAHDNLPQLFRHYADLARKGVAEAQYEVGQCYLRGRGVPASLTEGARWLYAAAQRGLPEAAFSLATLYAMGLPKGFDPKQMQLPQRQRPEVENESTPDYEKALFWSRQAAAQDHGEGQALLAHLLTHGPEQFRDLPKARVLYERAAQNDAPQGHLGLGLVLLEEARSETQQQRAARSLERAAVAGIGTAYATLGWMHENACGFPRDLEQAARCYEQAAELGLASAQARYGMMLLRGVGIKSNPVMAESWLRQAAYGGESDAAALLGDLYIRGEPPFNKPATALKWYRHAAEQGHVPAARALAFLYLSGTGTKPDQRQAAHWLRHAAEAGDSHADAELGTLLLLDEARTVQEGDQLQERLRQRARKGDMVSAYNLGVCLAQGIGGERNPAEALQWLAQARESVVNAQFWYGSLVFHGQGQEADPLEGLHWMEKAAQAGMTEACLAVGRILVNGHFREGPAGREVVIPPDHEKAVLLYRPAAERDDPEALFALGALFGGGHEVAEDRQKAEGYFRRAAELGHALAQLMLGRYLLKGLGSRQDRAEG
ncbi:hypothetical protein E3E11_04440 [Oecophyllibacter saccharovorans]|uniref:tetratricopeptide repeat protein n=1 Tax=Oecophyllibacter saccharovorans TaxID=2558360 RepID=UPI0011418B1F|nr:SEL1-like repeat protein [Oecophyllibacter saccharovorans]QDH15224.1 hypothetical protein E3E11_04440 [Oecophyllibacter saccharovorans]